MTEREMIKWMLDNGVIDVWWDHTSYIGGEETAPAPAAMANSCGCCGEYRRLPPELAALLGEMVR